VVASGKKRRPAKKPAAIESDEALLDRFQRAAFGYFVDTFNPTNGLIADNTRPGAPSSIAVVGFALSAYPVGVERGWMDRDEAAARALTILRFFWNARQDGGHDATGYKGFFYHFLDMATGARAWRCELSTIDTALLVAGMLTAAAYFTEDRPAESEIRTLADAIYRRVDWAWAQAGLATVRLGWKPRKGFLSFDWEGYSEAILLYALGLASPTFPLSEGSYAAWSRSYKWKKIYACELLYAGPLFIHLLSHAWIDFAKLRDEFMREKRSDYFENSRRAVWIQREYARRNPRGYLGYDENGWGFTAGDGPGRGTVIIDGRKRRLFGYVARGAPFGPDDGTLAPWASLAALPFAPESALLALRRLCTRHPRMVGDSRLPSGFNPSLTEDGPDGWVSRGYFGLDQGIVVLMVENHRSGLIWRLMRRCPYLGQGLRRANFSGGWL
jgi:hypothetical protein